MSYVLKWSSAETGTSHNDYLGVEDAYVKTLREARRFATKQEAEGHDHSSVYFGAGGKDDRVGWKVVRVVPKRPKAETSVVGCAHDEGIFFWERIVTTQLANKRSLFDAVSDADFALRERRRAEGVSK